MRDGEKSGYRCQAVPVLGDVWCSDALLKYCELDTFATSMVYEYLKYAINKKTYN